MAGIALILRYQWRAFWRRFIRNRRARSYLLVLTVLGGMLVSILPARLSRAARELSTGQATSMDLALWIWCLLWLFVAVEDASISLTSRHLRTFPIHAGRLLGVRVLSLFCSPAAMLVAFGSLISLWPLLFARQTVLGVAAALLLFALALGFAMSASHIMGVVELRRKLLAPVAVISITVGAAFFTRGLRVFEELRAVASVAPPHLVSAVSIAPVPSAAIIPLTTLVASCAIVCALLFWTFRRSLSGEPGKPGMGRAADSVLWFPGRFGGLVRKEQHYVRKLLDVWPGLLLVLAVSIASLVGPLPSIVRQSVIVIVFFLNTHMILNCFGLNTNAELDRYAILPLRGKDVLLVKNLGLAVIVAAQLVPLIVTAIWRAGLSETVTEVLEAAVLLLSHLAWGNLVSVLAPFKMRFYRAASGAEPLTAMAGSAIGSIPAVMVLVLLRVESFWSAAAIMGVLLLSLAVYLASLDYSGRIFERRRHVIGEQLA